MITKITGVLTRVLEEDARVQVGGFEYQVMVTEQVRRHLQMRVGKEVTLSTMHFFEGNPVQQGRMIPRLIGFVTQADLEFFDLFCSVDRVGVKKALKALSRPCQDIAAAIQREDVRWLTTLPGVGAATAEQIVTSLKRKVTRFSFASENESANGEGIDVAVSLIEEAYQGLMVLGMSPVEARVKLDKVLPGRKFETVEEIINAVFKQPTAK